MVVGSGRDALFGNRDTRASGEIVRGQRIFCAKNFLDAALGYDLATPRTCPWAKINNVVGRANGFFIVFNPDSGIAEAPQPPQRSEQARVVPLMQSNARLVQNVKNARKPRADLRRQPDPLRFSARKRTALPIEREVAEPDFNEKSQPRLNFAHDLARNHSLLRI